MKTFKTLLTVSALAVGALAATGAQAVQITGGVSFGGQAAPNTGDWDTATAVDFGNSPPNATVNGGTGDYAGVTPLTTLATFSDFSFDPILSPSPVSPLWTFTFGGLTYSFELVSVTENLTGDNDDLNLSGTGWLSITGFDTTWGEWDFSGQQSGTGGLVAFSFSASNAAINVPEPGSLLLLGLGLLAVGGTVRRKLS